MALAQYDTRSYFKFAHRQNQDGGPELSGTEQRNPGGLLDISAISQRNSDGVPDINETSQLSRSRNPIYHQTRVHRGKKTLYPLTLTNPYVMNNPNLCKNTTNLAFLTIVHTATNHFERRRLMRETWANKNLFKNISTRIVFMLGLTGNKTVQKLLENEQAKHADMVQGEFLDSYHNLTHKGVLAFRWIHEYCKHSKMIVKVDDDVFLNPFVFVQDLMPKYKDEERFVLCHKRPVGTSGIMRVSSAKWFVKADKFRGYKTFPIVHCFGFFVVISPDIIQSLYQASCFTPFFWIDDVYLYGMLPFQIGHVKHENVPEGATGYGGDAKMCVTNSSFCRFLLYGDVRDVSVGKKLWIGILKGLTKEQKELVNRDYILTSRPK
ncbi:hypothetical protein SNE40_017120 [Patella caerulea]|uniref:Hexosyltransferase n=1 Tax=Patella caerulea TaxID=87958 RepID=A0AAN8PDG4_PATCE